LRAAAVDGTDEGDYGGVGDDGGVGDALFGGLSGEGFDEYGVSHISIGNRSSPGVANGRRYSSSSSSRVGSIQGDRTSSMNGLGFRSTSSPGWRSCF
jgi:hypothetical protein